VTCRRRFSSFREHLVDRALGREVTPEVVEAERRYGDHKRFLAALGQLHADLEEQLSAQGVSKADRHQIWLKTENKRWDWLKEQTSFRTGLDDPE